MRKISESELKEILKKHKMWLESCGEIGERANLSNSDLSYSNLSRCDLSNSNLSYGNLSLANNVPYIPMACPDFGTFVGWKKCRCQLIVKLLIPYNAKRSSGTGRKCRCDEAVVLAIENLDGTQANTDYAVSIYYEQFVYKIGKTVSVLNFNENRFVECTEGIHFFINRQQAVEY